MTATLEFTILGSGSSGGVPRADGNWGVCDPAEPRNRRGRCSMMVRRVSDAPPDEWTTVVIDASPEFRIQTAAAGAKRLDAMLLTHDHADQSHGIDDIRAFALRRRARIDCWMDAATKATMLRRFGYIFEGEGMYPAIATTRDLPPHGEAWSVEGPSGPIPIVTFDQDHGGVRSIGYRIDRLAYSSDVVDLPPGATEALSDLDIWIVDALRMTPHPTHAHLALALEWIERYRPKRGILTNMHIDMDYATLARTLPAGVEPGYDGLRFTLEVLDGNHG
jgi:phosphoribosyl 1,2-cyclic phosphate phosphodiesterase